jgi:hypothetical protein
MMRNVCAAVVVMKRNSVSDMAYPDAGPRLRAVPAAPPSIILGDGEEEEEEAGYSYNPSTLTAAMVRMHCELHNN